MGADDGAAADVDGRAVPGADVEMMDARAGGDDIDDGVHGADLVEVDVVDGDVVDLRFGVAKQFEREDGRLLDRRVERRGLDQSADDGQRTSVGVRMVVRMRFVGVRGGIRVGMIVIMIVDVVMIMRVAVVVAGLVLVLGLRMPGKRLGVLLLLGYRLVGEVTIHEDVDLGAGDAASVDLLHLQACAEVECGGGVVEHLRRDSGIDQGPEEHIARDPGEAVKISNTHKKGLSRIRDETNNEIQRSFTTFRMTRLMILR
jgi:hypothetical protein